MEAFPHLDLPIPVQFTEVPKISSSSRRSRRVFRAPQTAEQLVEVPKIVSISSVHGLLEQNVDIPVLHGRGGWGGGRGLQGLRHGQNSTASGGAEHGDDPGPPQPPRRRSRRGMARVGHGPCATGPVERHIAQHNVVFLPCVQILDLPVRHMGDQVVEVLRKFDTQSVKQIFAVPKISFDQVPQRSAVRRPQKAEQLVEVPTEPGYALAVLASKVFSRRELRDILAGQGSTASGPELIVDFPGPRGDLQWSHKGQRTVEQNVDIPVQRGRGGRGGGSLQGFSPGQNSTAFHGAEHVDVPVPRREGLQGLRPRQFSTASSSHSPGDVDGA